MSNKEKIEFKKEYWRLEKGEIRYFSTYGTYTKRDAVKRLNELENENRSLKFELFRYRRIRADLDSIKEDIDDIERIEEDNEDGIIELLLRKDLDD